MNSFTNRVKKNLRSLKSWSEKYPCDAYRVYDRDIPEFAVSVDYYAGALVIYRYFNKQFEERDELHFAAILDGLKEVFGIGSEEIFVKERARQKGPSQYQRVASTEQRRQVQEGPLRFIVNLSDYLDTGLFLDHRSSRQWVRENSAGRRVLNLFCYTGAVSAHAISGGAESVVSVDLSATYLEWAAENFALNGFDASRYPLIRADVLRWLEELPDSITFDLIFLDPPSFSNSKKMDGTFDVQRDHEWLIDICMRHLTPHGVLFFSNNLRSFKISEGVMNLASVQDITRRTLPPDFRNELIHRAWLLRHKHGGSS